MGGDATLGDRELTDWIAQLYAQPDLLRMGHNQRADDLNLGLGWLYYGLARVLRPRHAVVIGSYRGFVPLVIARALADNLEAGDVTLVDPSLVDDFWRDRDAVARYVRSFGVENLTHHLATTQEFVETDAYRELEHIGLVFIDGYHSAEQARFDYRAFEHRLTPDGMVLFHDSMITRPSDIYGEEARYDIRVRDFVDELKRDPGLQVFDVPFGPGLTLVRKLDDASAEPLLLKDPARARD
jgi:predicted O-methyltransferase YrrM